MKVEINEEAVDEIVRDDLKRHALYLTLPDNDPCEFLGEKAELFAAFCKVIKYYSDNEQWAEFEKSTEGRKVE